MCSFPEFNFLLTWIASSGKKDWSEKLQRKVCCISSDHCSTKRCGKYGFDLGVSRVAFFSTNNTAATIRSKLTSSCVKLTLYPPPRPASVCAYLFSKIQKHLELKASEII